jgi:hypothetical protein
MRISDVSFVSRCSGHRGVDWLNGYAGGARYRRARIFGDEAG